MPFPISLNGSFEVEVPGKPEHQVGPLKLALENWLRENRVRLDYEGAQGVSFKVRMYRVAPYGTWNILVATNYGEVDFVPQNSTVRVNYRLRFTRLFTMFTSIFVLWLTFVISTSADLYRFETLGLPALIWLWAFGTHYLATWWRIPRALKQLVRDAVRGDL